MRGLFLDALWWTGAALLLGFGVAYGALLAYVIFSFALDKLRGKLK